MGRESDKFIVDSGRAATLELRGRDLVVRGTLPCVMEKPKDTAPFAAKMSLTIERVAVDHFVVAAPTLELATEYVADVLGIRPTSGGAHPGRGTHNALFGLGGGAYLEAIGADPSQPEPLQARAFGIDHLSAPKLVTWALRASDIDAVVGAFEHAHFGRSQSMSRRLEQGNLLQWRLAFPRQGVTAPAFTQAEPFLIDWGAAISPGFSLEPVAKLASVELNGRCRSLEEVVSLSDRAEGGFQVTLTLSEGSCDRLTAMIETPAGLVELSS